MEDLESAIGQILGNPERMAQILSLANSLGVGPPGPPGPDAPGPPPEGSEGPEGPEGGEPPLLSEELVGSLLSLLREAGHTDPRERQLLNALKPYCTRERQQRIDRALRIARISQVAGAALRTLNKKE